MNTLGDLLKLLRDRGFKPVAAKKGRVFVGKLACAKGLVPIKLIIQDLNFLSYPQISLTERPVFLPPLLPHIDILGNLCYFAPGSVTLDRYAPATALAQCLDQATTMLNRIADDPDYRIDDIQSEFPAHWEFGQLSMPWEVFLGDLSEGATSAWYFILKTESKKLALVTSDTSEAERLSKALGATMKVSHFRCTVLQTSIRPVVPTLMPLTIKNLFAWVRDWDPGLSKDLQNALNHKEYLQQTFAMFAVKTPVGWIGFGFELDQIKRIGYAKNPRAYRNYLHNQGGHQTFFRVALRELGSRFVHSRNLHYSDLYNKRVTIIGCGAIGSFVASAMVRLGAGTGKLGLLKLIDPDKLGPENLGRHALGFPALMKHKADALGTELRNQFPHNAIETHACSAFDHTQLFAADLIIDATGDESVSELLNASHLNRHKSITPILYLWIRGNGDAVQALWVDNSGGACYRCLLVPDPYTHRKERLPLLKTEPTRRTDGCRAFTPYAVSAPMHAAALATDMVCDWLQGNPSPRFRTRSHENADVFKVKNQNLSRIAGCPACAPK